MSAVLRLIASSRDFCLDDSWIAKLLRFDTTSRHTNLGLIEVVRDYLRGAGASVSMTTNSIGDKANLFATFASASGGTTGGIILSGHSDVVPVDGQAWTTDPFVPVVRDGKLFGRGTCDMKGFIGTVLDAVPVIAAAELSKPLHIAISYDEEVGCIGVRSLLEDVVRRRVEADSCIIGEPTSMRVVSAHKGRSSYRCRVHGKAAHSSLQPHGVNAIEYAAEIILFIKTLMKRHIATEARQPDFLVPYTTGVSTTIAGGNALNTIPSACSFTFEFRNLPGMNADELFEEVKQFANDKLVAEMQGVYEEANISFEQLSNTPFLSDADNEEILKLAVSLSRNKHVSKVAFTTEGGLFQGAGVPTVICGPGDIMQAHKPDEFVALAQLQECRAFVSNLVDFLRVRS